MSSKKDIWAQWDDAWEPGHTRDQRLAILQDTVAPTFTYSNMDSIVADGALDELCQLIETVLKTMSNLVVKHVRWHEQHGQSALQWDMVDRTTGVGALPGWSYGSYAEDGRLLAVADFW